MDRTRKLKNVTILVEDPDQPGAYVSPSALSGDVLIGPEGLTHIRVDAVGRFQSDRLAPLFRSRNLPEG